MGNSKLVDINGLSRYHENLKGVLNTKQNVIADLDAIRSGAAAGADAAADATSKANAAQAAAIEAAAADATSKANAAETAAKSYADGLVKDDEGKSLFDAAGSADAAQAAAEATAKEYADSLDTAMDDRVKVLEAIDHEQLTADAVAAVVAGAESDFDTLKEVADWIASDKEGSAALQATVSGHTESINTINGDIDALEENKQDVISDLETIRSNAELGATALREVPAEYVTETELNGKGYLTTNDLPFATEEDIDKLFEEE